MLFLKRTNFIYILSLFFLTSCGVRKIDKTAEIQLHFLDDYIIPDHFTYQNTKVGGLSGIDFDGNEYYMVCDDPKTPRAYKIDISLLGNKIDTIIFTKLIQLDEKAPYIKMNHLDLESILYNPLSKDLIISSEGSISRKKDPGIVVIDSTGKYLTHYTIPPYFEAQSAEHPRNNGLFEGLSRSVNNEGFWVASELPLESDGPKPKLYKTSSPIRITYYKIGNPEPQQQFSYRLDPIKKIPLLPFSMNGLSDLLEYKKDNFLVLERSFSAGRGNGSNSIRIFQVNAENATNTLLDSTLRHKKKTLIPASKKLVFDFKNVKKQLTQKHIDNIEGITFGPILNNGNQSIILISDNNFNAYGKQLNQVILMELVLKNKY